MKAGDIMAPDADASSVFNDYAAILNSRDQFLGYACYVCADQDFAYDLMTFPLLSIWRCKKNIFAESCIGQDFVGNI